MLSIEKELSFFHSIQQLYLSKHYYMPNMTCVFSPVLRVNTK